MNKIDSLDVCGKAVNAILDQSKGFNIKAPMLFSLASKRIIIIINPLQVKNTVGNAEQRTKRSHRLTQVR